MLGSAVTAKRWRKATIIPDDVRHLLREYHPIIAQVLYNRGQDTTERARIFLQGGDGALHNPFAMHGMPQAVQRIRQGIKRGELIAIYGDFDADGVTSTALLTQAIEALDGRVMPYIPRRVDEGYGLNTEALDQLQRQGVRLVVTVDCGIRSVDEVAHGVARGLDIIVTDHHSVGEVLPPALAVIDPKIDARLRLEEGRVNVYPEDMLAGVGVAYKLAEALFRAEEQQSRRRPALKLEDLLDLVAIGTVADLAPLDRPENRELVRRGLEVLNRAQRPGIYELAQVARLEPGRINTTSIGFMLGPRINAAGRLDDAMLAYRLLTTQLPEAGDLAQRLQDLNVERQNKTLEAVQIAQEQIPDAESALIFATDKRFQTGIVGLVAGRLCEEYYRPAVVLDHGEYESRGSCRSVPEFNITQALDQCADLLVRHGGHAQAAGFTVRNENIPVLRERLQQLAADVLRGQDLRPGLEIDVEVPLHHCTLDLAHTVRLLEPCGAKNEAPRLMTRRLRVIDCRKVGQDGKHLRLKLSDGTGTIDGIGFKQGDWADDIPPYIDAAYHLEVNEWNGSVKPQLNIQDLRPAGQGD